MNLSRLVKDQNELPNWVTLFFVLIFKEKKPKKFETIRKSNPFRKGVMCHGLPNCQSRSRMHLYEKEWLFLQRWEMLSHRGVLQRV
jgi:hypothetical protein